MEEDIKMALVANSSIKLNVHAPKKDAVVAVGTPTTGANDVSLLIGTAVDPYKAQSIIGDFHKVYRYAKTQLRNLAGTPAIVRMPQGGSDPSISVTGVLGAGEVAIEMGSYVLSGDRSHFLDRTFKRLVERWLEECKDNV